MARKKALNSGGEGTSSATKVPRGSGNIPAHSGVNPALKLSDTTLPAVDAKTTVDPPKGKTKRKSTQDKIPSPAKRKKTNSPLLSSVLDPNVHVSDRLQFNLNVEEKKPFKVMTPVESLNMAYELIARASVCLNYTAGTSMPLVFVELEKAHKELDEIKATNTNLSSRIEEITKIAEDNQLEAERKLKEAQNKASSL